MAFFSSIAIIGMAFRFPGDVQTESGLWNMLESGRLGVSLIPEDRWPVDELKHVNRTEPGRSVTFAAGVLSDVDKFDAAFFGISPREGAWLDPQQRLLLEMAHEAMEDAGVKPTSLAGSRCGVYIGISGLDYGQHALEDLASMSAYTMTGNTLSVAANRLSYFFDLHGPSVSVDTACSSSLVALHHACQALRYGEIPVALVGGVNLLMHPYSFIGFSHASMLSVKGMCRPFDAAADGYVRAEGGAVLLLKPLAQARKDRDPIHAVILSTGVNADGARKAGLTIPSAAAQTELMRDVLAMSGLHAKDIDFIEAHGTGTPVGDPVEASSIGQVYGQGRRRPIPISSVKANLGHLEPASGMAGLVKAVLSLKMGVLPPMPLEFTPNPKIDFEALNVMCAASGLPLQRKSRRPLTAGVNSFGFGGVNAHTLLQAAPTPMVPRPTTHAMPPLLLSARSDAALRALAEAYAEQLDKAGDEAYYDIAYSAAFHRDRLERRLILAEVDPVATVRSLRSFAAGENATAVVTESALPEGCGIVFVYTGNGAQWAGMGRKLYETSATFRGAVEYIDQLMRPLAGFSLTEALLQARAKNLQDTTISQPMLFAVQVGVTMLLREQGITPQAVTGHSVGEIAAAWAAGALSLEQAVQVIYARSHAQGQTRGGGRMAAVGLSHEAAEGLIQQMGLTGCLEIAGINSPNNVTLSGSLEVLLQVEEYAQRQNVFFRLLDLDYAFHSNKMDEIREALAQDLHGLAPSQAENAVFVSTVTGHALEGTALGSDYWWSNVRQPVCFASALEELAASGFRIFVEIGPHAILQRYIRENLSVAGVKGRVLSTLLRGDDGEDRIIKLASRLHSLTDKSDLRALFPYKGRRVRLPLYPWQKQRCWYPRTSECQVDKRRVHPLLGWLLDDTGLAWENILDPAKDTWLSDHSVGGAIVFPGAGYAEMALSAARAWLGQEPAAIESLDIVTPLVFENGYAQCVRCRLNPADGSIQIVSRPRLGTGEWVQHALGRAIAVTGSSPATAMKPLRKGCREVEGATLYALAGQLGLTYGPTFRVVEHLRMAEDRLDAVLRPVDGTERCYVLHPAALDACFHALAGVYAGQDAAALFAFLPIRTGRIERCAPGAVSRIRARVNRSGRRSMSADFELLDATGSIVAKALDCRFRAVPLAHGGRHAVEAWSIRPWFTPLPDQSELAAIPPLEDLIAVATEAAPSRNVRRGIWFKQILPLMEAMVLSASARAFQAIATEDLSDSVQLSGPYARWLQCLLRDEGQLSAHGGERPGASDGELPPVEELWREAFRLAPQCLPSLLQVGRVSRRLQDVLLGKIDGRALLEEVQHASVARESRSMDPACLGIDVAVNSVVRHLARNWPAHRRLRVLEVAVSPGALTELLERQLPEDHFEYVLALTDDAILAQARLRYGDHPAVSIVSTDAAQWDFCGQSSWYGHFDVILLRHTLHNTADCAGALEQMRRVLAPGGLLLVAERYPDWSADFVAGLDPTWWHQPLEASPDRPVSSLLSPEAWQQIIGLRGFGQCRVYRELAAEDLDEGAYLLLTTAEQAASAPEPEAASWLLLADVASRPLAKELCARLEARGQKTRCVCDEASLPDLETDHVVFMRGYDDSPRLVTSTLDYLRRCVHECAARRSAPPRLWIMTRGGALGTGLPDGYTPRPAQCAVTGLGRVIMNEYCELRCTLIDAPTPEECPMLAVFLENELLHSDGAGEIVLTPRARYTLKLGADTSAVAAQATDRERCRLDFAVPGRLGNLAWQADTERPLATMEIEARVMATGLNFRDVMLTMGLLPDDALENGFAGPNLGLEFAGVVTRVGAGVLDLRVGDRVVGFAPSCFASHVVTPIHTVARMPERWGYEAAATIPTVFFTAWYALKHLARLQPGESVLIHGAAGGVGIAAIQIARHLRAKIFATAGSEEKRDFLRLLGVEHVFDSRSLSFADHLLAATGGQGVDAVLNSLAGEAMRRSIGLLKPFGRFLELGKRDFVENTALGLRPFKENISYFAIDVDQLLTARPETASALFQEVMHLLHEGVLMPLPYRAFPTTQVVAAFRAMQQAQHMGKIVVTPAELPAAPAAQVTTTGQELDGESTWLMTGGLSGFGLATARHLAERGVKHLVLVGRRGASTPGAERILQEFSVRGINARAEACDMSDAAAVRMLVARIAETMPPLRGIVHAAAVFDDRFLAKLDRESLEKVLAPKLSGAWHLHEATLGLPLTHFVLYSSISVALGNPGQGNYVSANAGLEGLARLRNGMGLPALCIAWGPVGDAGYLTRHESVKESLAQHLGKTPLTSGEAMQALDAELPRSGVHIRANVDWGTVLRVFPEGASRFSLVGGEEGQPERAESSEDIQYLLAGKSPEEVMEIVRRLITEEVAQVLALGVAQVAPDRSVQSMGLDSLMAVELAVGLEQRIGVRLPAMLLQDSPTVDQIAERVVARLAGTAREEKADGAMLAELARRHAEDLTESEVSDIMRGIPGGEDKR